MTLLDIDWKKPDWPDHLDKARLHRPWLATVPDTMTAEDLGRTLAQAEEIAPYCDHPLLVPKAHGLIQDIPLVIGSKSVVLGYSIPTAYGGTELMPWEFRGFPVHLLGGNPRRQAELIKYMPSVVSVDGNLAWRLARRGVVMKTNGAAGRSIREYDGVKWPKEDMPLEVLRRSLENLRVFWERRLPGRIYLSSMALAVSD